MSDEYAIKGSCQMRKTVFLRTQLLSNLLLILCIVVGVLSVHKMVESQQVRLSLTLILFAMSIVIASVQLVTVASAISRLFSPVEYLWQSLSDWNKSVLDINGSVVTLDKIRSTMAHLQKMSHSTGDKWPHEVAQLQQTFYATLKLMESAWQKAETDAIMVGLGGVCSQVAHDMRSPATSIKVLSKAILNVGTQSEREELSTIMSLSAEKLNRMADELLSYRKAGIVELKPVDLSNIVRDTCRELQMLATDKHVDLVCTIPPDQDFLGDADQMGRMIQNLVGNAIQAVERQENGRVEVRMECTEKQIILNIQDNGPGIPSDHVDKMFQSGFTTKGKNGNGLGLIYCANVVKGHGGHISARNKPEGGAEFRIELPVQVAH